MKKKIDRNDKHDTRDTAIDTTHFKTQTPEKVSVSAYYLCVVCMRPFSFSVEFLNV